MSGAAASVVGYYPYKRREDVERLGTGLIKAGMCCQDKLEGHLDKVPLANITFTRPVDMTEGFEKPEGVTLLTEAKIHEMIVGNTISRAADTEKDKKKWSEYYLTDGTLSGIWGERRYCDYWAISGPIMCIGHGVEGYCNVYALEGTTITRFKLDGTLYSTGKLLRGNPEKL